MINVRSILLAEDDVFQQKLIKRLLERKLGVTVLTAKDGNEARSILKTNNVDAIVSDLAMPESDGVSFLYEHFHSNDGSLPVVIISASPKEVMNSAKNMAPKARQSHVKIVGKPIGVAQVDMMSEWLQGLSADTSFKSMPAPSSERQIDLSFDALKKAIDAKQFVPFFQGQFCGKSHDLRSLEALVRWRHPEFGDLTPNQFLDAIYANDLGVELSMSMFEQMMRLLAKWRHLDPNLGLSMNLSQLDLCSDKLLEHMDRIMQLYRIPSPFLTIEVTESETAFRKEQFLRSTSSLRLRGVNLAIDDFGTGFSSLTNLVDGPYNEIKIDISYVQRMITCKRCLAAVESIVTLGYKLDMTIVAEGVETQAQAEILHRLGCHKLQGYWFNKPMDSATFEAFLIQHKVSVNYL